jgi:hypothetical protein
MVLRYYSGSIRTPNVESRFRDLVAFSLTIANRLLHIAPPSLHLTLCRALDQKRSVASPCQGFRALCIPPHAWGFAGTLARRHTLVCLTVHRARLRAAPRVGGSLSSIYSESKGRDYIILRRREGYGYLDQGMDRGRGL